MPLIRRVLDIKQRLLDRVNLYRAYNAVFATDEGNRVLRHILREGYVTRSTFVAGDPHQTTLNEGSRRLALSILKAAKIGGREQIEQIEEQLKNEQL